MNDISIQEKTRLIDAAFLKATEVAIDTAERTGTPVIVWENGAMVRLKPADARRKLRRAIRAGKQKPGSRRAPESVQPCPSATPKRAPKITYRSDVRPPLDAIIALYRAAPLNRPIEDPDRIARMYAGSNMVHSAWNGKRLVGILRGWTDGAFDGYVSDLAVHPNFQEQGIGRELLRRVIESNHEVQFVLRASKVARDYYSHVGWQAIENGWFLPRES
jgi:ribosomal protein S18 acetylase RimI-like enzyme